MTLISKMDGVREYAEGFPVELVWNDELGRAVIVGINQDGYDGVEIDLLDLVQWLQNGKTRKPAE